MSSDDYFNDRKVHNHPCFTLTAHGEIRSTNWPLFALRMDNLSLESNGIRHVPSYSDQTSDFNDYKSKYKFIFIQSGSLNQ